MAGVFISYRRSDSAGHTGRLADSLGDELEDQALFRDIEKIQPGEDFVEVLEKAVAACSVMLVVIGPQWVKAETPDGKRRLKQEGDFVRMEVETALARGIRLIPVLVGDAAMPTAEDLPESMAPLLRRHAHSISDRRWAYDLGELIDILEKIPGVSRRKHETPAPAASVPASAPAAAGMSTATKAIAGAVAILAVVAIAILLGRTRGDAQPANTPPATTLAPTTAATAGLTGAWRDGNGMPFYLRQTGEKLAVTAGAAVDAALMPQRKPGAAAGSDFPSLKGEGKLSGQKVRIKLRNADEETSSVWDATLASDGRSMAGKMYDEPEGVLIDFTLRRE
jgi:TIR domain